MSLQEPFNYFDTAAEIMDEIELKECSLAEVIERLELAFMEDVVLRSKTMAEAARKARTQRTTFHMRLSKLRARYGQR